MFKMKIMILPLLLFVGSVFSEVFAMHNHALQLDRAKAVTEVVETHIHLGIIDEYRDKHAFALSAAEVVRLAIVQVLQCDNVLLQSKVIKNKVAKALVDFVHKRYVETRTPARSDLKAPALEVIENGLNWYRLSKEIVKETALESIEAESIALAVQEGVALARASVANGFAIPEDHPASVVSDTLVKDKEKDSVITYFCYIVVGVVAGIAAGLAY